jgi:superfamily I DNA/RNA helicase
MAKKDWMVIESELDEDQIRVLMATLDKSCVVSGCAGSGKSVLALIKAQRIQKEKGNNYKIIVFTKALCRYMNAGKEMLGLENDFFYHWDWRERNNCSPANYIIVDEIQDFSQEEIEEFIAATNNNFFFFGDTAQSIYEGLKETLPVEEIRNLLPQDKRPKIFELYRNYRLPISVARVVQHVGIDLDGYDESTYKSVETSIPIFIQFRNFEEQIKSIADIIKKRNLLDVGILVPHNENVKQVSDMLNKFSMSHEVKYKDKRDWTNSVDNLNFTTTNPKVMTYHSAKGLQFESVFIPAVSELTNDEERRISEQKALYVAMTRTYRYLYIMYNGELPYPLSDVPKELYHTSEIEEIEDL